MVNTPSTNVNIATEDVEGRYKGAETNNIFPFLILFVKKSPVKISSSGRLIFAYFDSTSWGLRGEDIGVRSVRVW